MSAAIGRSLIQAPTYQRLGGGTQALIRFDVDRVISSVGDTESQQVQLLVFFTIDDVDFSPVFLKQSALKWSQLLGM